MQWIFDTLGTKRRWWVAWTRLRGNSPTPLILLLLLAACVYAAPQSTPAQRDIFLPIIAQPVPTSPLPTPTSSPTPMPTRDPVSLCFGNDNAAAFYRLLILDPRQQRPQLDCHPALVRAAQWRAEGLAQGDPWGHTDAGGVTANEYARQSGCRLPPHYASKGNNIESLAAGSPDVLVIYGALTGDNAPDHRRHLLGENDFFRQQTHAGIAYIAAPGSEYGHYWVILLGQCIGLTSGERVR